MRSTALAFMLLLAIAAPERALGADAVARVLIPKGAVTLGTDIEDLKKIIVGTEAKPQWYADESPSKKTETGTFEIDAFEVTNKRYKDYFKEHSYPPNMDNHPVVNVTWQEANDYCRATGGKLPSEAEWVRAARGDTTNLYPWGNDFSSDRAVYMDTPGGGKAKVGSYSAEQSGETLLGGTHPVGSMEVGKSQSGAQDMAGNVWEWVDGWYDEGKKLRMLKGGSWLSPKESLRVAAKLGDDGNGRFNDYGFRCAYGK